MKRLAMLLPIFLTACASVNVTPADYDVPELDLAPLHHLPRIREDNRGVCLPRMFIPAGNHHA